MNLFSVDSMPSPNVKLPRQNGSIECISEKMEPGVGLQDDLSMQEMDLEIAEFMRSLPWEEADKAEVTDADTLPRSILETNELSPAMVHPEMQGMEPAEIPMNGTCTGPVNGGTNFCERSIAFQSNASAKSLTGLIDGPMMQSTGGPLGTSINVPRRLSFDHNREMLYFSQRLEEPPLIRAKSDDTAVHRAATVSERHQQRDLSLKEDIYFRHPRENSNSLQGHQNTPLIGNVANDTIQGIVPQFLHPDRQILLDEQPHFADRGRNFSSSRNPQRPSLLYNQVADVAPVYAARPSGQDEQQKSLVDGNSNIYFDSKKTSPVPVPDPYQVMKRLEESMSESATSLAALQEWDKKHGLPKSHAPTMVHSSRSRKQLQEGVILSKWNGAPLIDF